VWSTLLDFRDWPSWVYVALGLLLFVYLPERFYKVHRHAAMLTSVIDSPAWNGDGRAHMRERVVVRLAEGPDRPKQVVFRSALPVEDIEYRRPPGHTAPISSAAIPATRRTPCPSRCSRGMRSAIPTANSSAGR